MNNKDNNLKVNNDFYLDLLEQCNKYKVKDNVLERIKDEWSQFFLDIKVFLYEKLSKEDKDILLRYFLKRFYKIDTITEKEREDIDRAYENVRKLYKIDDRDYIEFEFRDKKIIYKKHSDLYEDESLEENILMNYYDVAHAFYLIEYELEGYNPVDGQTILDCGGAYGDTMLLFRALYPNSSIHSFEAVEENTEKIREHVRINKIENVTINTAFLYRDSERHYLNQKNYRIVDEKTDYTKEIKTLSIDDYVEEYKITNIGLIKFDIEGAEQEALKGAVKTIKNQKPILYIPIYHFKSDIYKIPQFLSNLNLPMYFSIKWTEKKVWGMDCVLFVKFE